MISSLDTGDGGDLDVMKSGLLMSSTWALDIMNWRSMG